MRTILAFIIALVFANPMLQAQHDHLHHEGEICGTMQNLEILKQQDPGLEARMAQIERLTSQWIQKKGDGHTEGGEAVITIPVVVHILYSSSSQNISDAQVMSQIDVLNKDFRRMNTDTSLTPAIFKPFAADAGIEFCLASRDPQGGFTTGITRTQTSVTTFNQMNNNAKFTSMGGKDAWPASSYLNIWVCNLSSGLLGYAQFPGSNPATDGVVIHYTAFGTMGTASAPYNKGRTTTHEIGHWLNLYHIWGDDNGACTGTDYVGDTPNQGNNYYGCPSHPQVSCGSEDMFMNYMDYANDACSNVFTQGQKDRMQAAVSIWRNSLQFSQGCLTQAPLADFSVDHALTTAGCAVNFTDLSVGPPQSWQWIFENGQPATSNVQNPQAILFNQPGSWDVTLVVHNALGYDTLFMPDLITVSDTLRPEPQFSASRKFVCTDESVYFIDQSLFCPNSWQWLIQPESYSFVNGTGPASQHPVIQFHASGEYHVTLVVGNLNGQRSQTHFALIRAGGLPLPFNEDFEGNSFALREWTIENPNNDFTWQIQQAPSVQANNLAASVQIFGTNSFARRDAMISAPLNLSAYATAYLSFRHAYAQYQPQFSDSLIVYVSGDCGLTWTPVLKGGDNGSGNWATSPPNTSSFVPAGPDDWCWSGFGSPCYSIDLSAWAGQENVKVKFESYSSLSNNIYLDDIQISDVLSTRDLGSYDKAVHIYPNPSTGIIHLRTEGLSGKFLLRLNNLHGSTVLEEVLLIDQGYYLRSYNLSALPTGMYLMNLVGDSQNYAGKVILR